MKNTKEMQKRAANIPKIKSTVPEYHGATQDFVIAEITKDSARSMPVYQISQKYGVSRHDALRFLRLGCEEQRMERLSHGDLVFDKVLNEIEARQWEIHKLLMSRVKVHLKQKDDEGSDVMVEVERELNIDEKAKLHGLLNTLDKRKADMMGLDAPKVHQLNMAPVENLAHTVAKLCLNFVPTPDKPKFIDLIDQLIATNGAVPNTPEFKMLLPQEDTVVDV